MSKKQQQKFMDLYEPVHDRFEKFCRARAYNAYPYEDLMNETLLIAYQKIKDLENPASFLSFLIGISRKLLANSRKKMRAQNGIDELITRTIPDPHNQIEKANDIELLHYSLSKLPALQQEALILYEITGFSIREIGKVQDSSESAVKQRLSRGRKSLKQIVSKTLSLKKGERYE